MRNNDYAVSSHFLIFFLYSWRLAEWAFQLQMQSNLRVKFRRQREECIERKIEKTQKLTDWKIILNPLYKLKRLMIYVYVVQCTVYTVFIMKGYADWEGTGNHTKQWKYNSFRFAWIRAISISLRSTRKMKGTKEYNVRSNRR